jgi:RNA polymerase sigma-70 factor, ECF subfamily
MADGVGREPEKYRLLLKLQVRTMQLDPRLRRRFDSSDLVQEAYLKAHLNREKFEGNTEAQFVKWLKRIVENVVKDKCREHKAVKRDIRREQDLQRVVSESSVRLEKMVAAEKAAPGQRLEQHERELQLAAALEQLPEDQRDAIILRHVHGLSLDQAAEQMGRSEKAVSDLVARARRTLCKILDMNQ